MAVTVLDFLRELCPRLLVLIPQRKNLESRAESSLFLFCVLGTTIGWQLSQSFLSVAGTDCGQTPSTFRTLLLNGTNLAAPW